MVYRSLITLSILAFIVWPSLAIGDDNIWEGVAPCAGVDPNEPPPRPKPGKPSSPAEPPDISEPNPNDPNECSGCFFRGDGAPPVDGMLPGDEIVAQECVAATPEKCEVIGQPVSEKYCSLNEDNETCEAIDYASTRYGTCEVVNSACSPKEIPILIVRSCEPRACWRWNFFGGGKEKVCKPIHDIVRFTPQCGDYLPSTPGTPGLTIDMSDCQSSCSGSCTAIELDPNNDCRPARGQSGFVGSCSEDPQFPPFPYPLPPAWGSEIVND